VSNCHFLRVHGPGIGCPVTEHVLGIQYHSDMTYMVTDFAEVSACTDMTELAAHLP